MKKSLQFLFFVPFVFISLSCEKEYLNGFSAEVKFDISGRLLAGHQISCIDFDQDGNPVIGSGTAIYLKDKTGLKKIETGYNVLDLAIADDNSIWFGSGGGGLGHLSHNTIRLYNASNAGLPRDWVSNVEVAPDGSVWFSSCAHQLGGLGVFRANQFTFLTPENSPLNQNIIEDIEISNTGVVYIATSGTVGHTNIYRLFNNSWKCLGNEEGTFYWIMSFTLSHSGDIYLVEDFSLSSALQQNRIFRSTKEGWEILESGDMAGTHYYGVMKADRRNFCWVAYLDEGSGLAVLDGKSLHKSPASLFSASFITAIEADNQNNIWVGTHSDGIFILNQ